MALLGGHVQCILCNNLLTLPKRDVVKVLLVCREAQLVAQILYVFEWIHTRTEHKEDRCGRPCLLVGHLKWSVAFLHILAAQFVLDK